MTFEEAAGRYAELRAQLQAGKLDFADFQAAAARLTVVDPNGDWWQIDPASGEWLTWDGTAWVRPGEKPAAEETKPVERQYSLLIQTQDYRAQLKSDGEDSLWVYAAVTCSDTAVDCGPLAGTIELQADGPNSGRVTLSAPAPVEGAVAALVTALKAEVGSVLAPGGVKIVASATIEGQSVSAEVDLELSGPDRVELAPLLWTAQPDPRGYKDLNLARCELIADGEDEIEFAVMFLPAELISEGADPAALTGRASGQVRLKRACLTGQGRENFNVESVPSNEPGVFRLKVKSRRPLLATEENSRIDVALEVEGELAAEAAGQYRLREAPASLPVHSKFLFLKLIVVPAARQGASEAMVYVGTAPGSAQPLRDVACQLDVVSLGSGPTLAPQDDATKRTGASGVASWVLEYKGATWSNVGETRFKVRAGVKGPEGLPLEATWVEIDVNANGQRFLADLATAAGDLGLNNPAFQGRGGILAQMWPDSIVGPLNDVCSLASESNDWRHYTCRQMRDRVWRFAMERRYSSELEQASAMNGLEFTRYEIAPIHECCGLTLAGNNEPYYIDPWWEQTYHPDRAVVNDSLVKDRLSACVVLMEAVGAAVMVNMGAAETAVAGAKCVGDWLEGGVANSPLAAGEGVCLGGSHKFRFGRVALSQEQWLNDDGSYKEAPAGWGESFFKSSGNEMTTGTVSPLEGW